MQSNQTITYYKNEQLRNKAKNVEIDDTENEKKKGFNLIKFYQVLNRLDKVKCEKNLVETAQGEENNGPTCNLRRYAFIF